MISEAERKIAREKFERAAREFGFVFHSPFDLTDTISVFGYIENYGSKNGTVICLDHDEDLRVDPRCVGLVQGNGMLLLVYQHRTPSWGI